MLRCILGLVLLTMLLLGNSTPAQQGAKSTKRFGVDIDPENFPQKTAKECLGSVVRALDRRRIDYLMAQLADPAYVDKRVQALGGNFRELVQETTERIASDPTILKELRRFLSDGEWEESEEAATVKLKDVKGKSVYLRKVEDRWIFENRQKGKEEPKEKEKEKEK